MTIPRTADSEPAALRQALAYAARSWPVFPCRPDLPRCPDPGGCQCKAPMTAHGFQDASIDPARIRAWWSRWPDANVAIATGAPGPDVLDVDVKPEGTGYPSFNRLKAAGLLAGAQALVRTPRGGLHAYYQGTSQRCGSLTKAGHFIDFKATDGYVLAPPSMVHGLPYEVLDHRAADGRIDWQAVCRLLNPPRVLPGRRMPEKGTPDGLVAFVASQREGNRNAGLFWAACRCVETGHVAALDTLADAAIAAGLPEPEVRRTIASAARRAER